MKRFFNRYGTALIAAGLLVLVVRTFLFAPYIVHGESMLPSLDSEERILVNKWVYRMHSPDYEDIIVFRATEGRDFVKRVIGLPGDVVTIEDGQVIRNGKKLKEPYLTGKIAGDFPPTRVSAHHLFVLGDNRNNSMDSRQLGLVDLTEVVGRADLILMPLDKIDWLS
ncbi:signal peptidase I [Salinithrix halophila]|uniref:Signal peptidase I n=1 Tax=Salinithrix halophila TaxID=1485204 RepID=A0ABV8JAN9_9BACL